jgi:ligand-binding SRPBCC domain-containing protein
LFVVKDSIHINAPIERCFLLSTNLKFVTQLFNMRLVAKRSSRASGTILGGDRLLWRGWKFGLPQTYESVITGFERPGFFQNTVEGGRFQRLQIDHYLSEVDGHTLLIDKLRFSPPLVWPGKIVARRLVVPHLSGLLRKRLVLLKLLAEGEGWRQYLTEDGVRSEYSETVLS